MPSFRAKVDIIGVNPYVIPPEDVLQRLFFSAKKSRSPIPVKGILNSHPFIQTLVKYQGVWRLYLNTPMRNATKTVVGDIVAVTIEYDPSDRTLPIPEAFKKALKANKTAQKTFEALPPYRQKEIIRYLGFLKNADSLQRNLEKVMKYLSGEKVDHVLLRK